MKFLIFFLPFITLGFTLGNQVKLDSNVINEVADFILKNPKSMDTIDQKQFVDAFSKIPMLNKFLFNSNGSKRIDWNRLLNDKVSRHMLEKFLNTRNQRDIFGLFNLFQPIIDIVKSIIEQILSLPDCHKVGLKYSTEKSKIPDQIEWSQIGFGKELLNQLTKVIVIGGGKNPIDNEAWKLFKPVFPYEKNIDRNLLFQSTFFYRSPDTDVNCKNESCIRQILYKNYTWVQLAKAVCVSYIPSKQSGLSPMPGFLVSSTIKKCQAIRYEKEVYQLSDNNGNYYAMHAFENDGPNLSVVLPSNWTLSKISLTQPLIVSPFGGGNDCYFNILRDHLGQGYHQYVYANQVYP